MAKTRAKKFEVSRKETAKLLRTPEFCGEIIELCRYEIENYGDDLEMTPSELWVKCHSKKRAVRNLFLDMVITDYLDDNDIPNK